MKKFIIAIDGPSGVGKSTLSKLLAQELGYINLDTGAMYRAVALETNRRGVDVNDHAALGQLCGEVEIAFARDGAKAHVGSKERVLLNDEDVSQQIRTPEISLLTAQVAACAEVREALVQRQRELGAAGGVVLEGRDVGTVVFPQAQVKFYLTASAQVRGQRRYLELQLRGEQVSLDQTVTEVEARDAADMNRAIAPLRKAEDAIEIDTSELEIPQVLQRMLDVITRKLDGLG